MRRASTPRLSRDWLGNIAVFLAEIEGIPLARNEIAELAWLDRTGACAGTLAPAVEKHVVPRLQERGLLAAI